MNWLDATLLRLIPFSEQACIFATLLLTLGLNLVISGVVLHIDFLMQGGLGLVVLSVLALLILLLLVEGGAAAMRKSRGR